MLERHTIEEEKRYTTEREKFRVTCKCGYRTFVFPGLRQKYIICLHCGNKVYGKKDNFKNNLLETIEKLKENDTFTCKNCNEIVEEEHRAENGYEQFGEYDLCEWCYEEMKEDMR